MASDRAVTVHVNEQGPARINGDCLLILPPGSPVTIGEMINAEVVSVEIGSNSTVRYRCVWWDGNERKDQWLEAFEVEPNEKTEPSIRVGFQRQAV